MLFMMIFIIPTDFITDSKKISPKMLTIGGFQRIRVFKTKCFLVTLRSLFIQGTYDIVDMVWKIRNLYQGRRWFTWSIQEILSI